MNPLIKEIDNIFYELVRTGMNYSQAHASTNEILTEITQSIYDAYIYARIAEMKNPRKKRDK